MRLENLAPVALEPLDLTAVAPDSEQATAGVAESPAATAVEMPSTLLSEMARQLPGVATAPLAVADSPSSESVDAPLFAPVDEGAADRSDATALMQHQDRYVARMEQVQAQWLAQEQAERLLNSVRPSDGTNEYARDMETAAIVVSPGLPADEASTAAESTGGNEAGPGTAANPPALSDAQMDADAALLDKADAEAVLQGVGLTRFFSDSNSEMLDRLKDKAEATLAALSDRPVLSLDDAEVARENRVLQNKAAMQAPSAEPPTVADLERQYKRDHSSPAVPQFDARVSRDSLSVHSLEVLNRVALEAGVDIGKLRVTSSIRTPADQARIMYEQLENGTISQYGPAGQQLIAIYREGVAAGNSAEAIRARMAERAQVLLDQGVKVSNHLGNPLDMNVFDIAPSSIPAGKTQAFQSALNAAQASGDLRNFLSPYTSTYDPAFHLEIDQPTSRANQNTQAQNQAFRQHEIREMNASAEP